MQTIRGTIPHAKEIEELSRASLDVKLSISSALHPWLGKLTFRLGCVHEYMHSCHSSEFTWTLSSSAPSNEGYEFTLIIADDASKYLWVYGLNRRVKLMLRLGMDMGYSRTQFYKY